MLDVAFPPGKEIVEADDLMPLLDKSLAEMGTKKSGTASNQNAHRNRVGEKVKIKVN
jgi:hypothetical protein